MPAPDQPTPDRPARDRPARDTPAVRRPAADPAALSRRARFQWVFALVSAVLTILAALLPAWIEQSTGLAPDGGSGELEWLLAAGFGVVSMVFGILAFRTRQRLSRVRSAGGARSVA